MMNVLLMVFWPEDVFMQMIIVLFAITVLSTAVVSWWMRRAYPLAESEKQGRVQNIFIGLLFVVLFIALRLPYIFGWWIGGVMALLGIFLGLRFLPSVSGVFGEKRLFHFPIVGGIMGCVGIVLMIKAGLAGGLSWQQAISFDSLLLLNAQDAGIASLVKMAFLFLFFSGTSFLGIFPFHGWFSGLLAKYTHGEMYVFLSFMPLVTVLGLWRVRYAVDVMLGDGGVWTSALFLLFGGISVVVLGVSLLWQKNYFHATALIVALQSALVFFMTGLGPAGIIPASMHLFTQVLVTNALVAVLSGLYATYKTRKCSGVRQLEEVFPEGMWAGIGTIAAVSALPFSGFFVSQFIAFGYGLQEHMLWTMVVVGAMVAMSAAVVKAYTLFLLPLEDGERSLPSPLPKVWRRSIGAVAMVNIIFTVALTLFWGTSDGIQMLVNALGTLSNL